MKISSLWIQTFITNGKYGSFTIQHFESTDLFVHIIAFPFTSVNIPWKLQRAKSIHLVKLVYYSIVWFVFILFFKHEYRGKTYKTKQYLLHNNLHLQISFRDHEDQFFHCFIIPSYLELTIVTFNTTTYLHNRLRKPFSSSNSAV